MDLQYPSTPRPCSTCAAPSPTESPSTFPHRIPSHVLRTASSHQILSSHMGDAAPPPPASSSSGFSYLAVLGNCPLVAAVLAFAIAQSIKVFTTWYKENRWDAKQLVGSGGMPSSHSATVTALAVAVGLQEGFGSSLFATAAIFASVHNCTKNTTECSEVRRV